MRGDTMSSDNKPGLTCVEDGPYVVKGLKRFSNKNGAIDSEDTIALCRCGASENKPFCDGTHAKIGFTSKKSENRLEDKQDAYTGTHITIHDNRSICAHAGFCTDGLDAVFRMKQEPWINADAATVDEIISTIEKCPSGALSYSINGAQRKQEAREPSIHIAPNGPYVVCGGPGFVKESPGKGASLVEFALCRCGGSANKPFCDGSHWSNGFSDDKN